jgi:mannose-6-phosphate isomerase-like protein (cupin superfamily)
MTHPIVVNREQSRFSTLQQGEIGRDVFVMHETPNITSGITRIHPRSRTQGHAHPRREEHYYVLSGRGYVLLDDQRYDIQAGDDVNIPPVSLHTVVNPYDEPLEFFWAAPSGEPKIPPPIAS